MAANKVGTLIKSARTEAGLTQEQLAKKITGLSASAISKAERGEAELTTDQLKSIAKATGVTQKSLLEAAKESSSSTKTTSGSSAKTTSVSSTKTTSGSGSSTSDKSGSDLKLTATEKKLLELYRAADSDTKKSVMKLLKGEEEETEIDPLKLLTGESSGIDPMKLLKGDSNETGEVIASILGSVVSQMTKK